MAPNKKVLIIEDNVSIRTMLEKLFQANNYDVDVANDGESGLTYAKQGGYNAIILDLKMPQMDGLEFLKQLQGSLPHSPNGPAIVYSSASYDYAKDEALRTGAAAFIPKEETEPQNLLQQVEDLINHPPKAENG